MNTKKNEKGFTLAELLVVVAIIAIMVAIMIPVFGSSTKKATLETDVANVRSTLADLVATEMTADDFDGTVTIAKSKLDAAAPNSTVTDDATADKLTVTLTSDTSMSEEIPYDSDITIE